MRNARQTAATCTYSIEEEEEEEEDATTEQSGDFTSKQEEVAIEIK